YIIRTDYRRVKRDGSAHFASQVRNRAFFQNSRNTHAEADCRSGKHELRDPVRVVTTRIQEGASDVEQAKRKNEDSGERERYDALFGQAIVLLRPEFGSAAFRQATEPVNNRYRNDSKDTGEYRRENAW